MIEFGVFRTMLLDMDPCWVFLSLSLNRDDQYRDALRNVVGHKGIIQASRAFLNRFVFWHRSRFNSAATASRIRTSHATA